MRLRTITKMLNGAYMLTVNMRQAVTTYATR